MTCLFTPKIMTIKIILRLIILPCMHMNGNILFLELLKLFKVRILIGCPFFFLLFITCKK